MTFTFATPASEQPAEITAMLLAQWVMYFAADRLGIDQSGVGGGAGASQTYTFGDPTANHFKLALDLTRRAWTLAEVVGISESRIEAVVKDALARTAQGDTGPALVYEAQMQTQSIEIGAGLSLHFMRLLGDQVRIQGRRRLGDRVLLEFCEEAPDDPTAPPLFAPRVTIRATLIVPGPTAGQLTQSIAGGMGEVTAAVCSLALGRPVEAPMMGFPVTGEAADEALSLRNDASILGLACEGISLDIFGELAARAGGDGVLRARGALLSYQAALEQHNPDVAIMLLVTAIEALIAPRPAWGREKVTKRFIQAVQELCPQTEQYVAPCLPARLTVGLAYPYGREFNALIRRAAPRALLESMLRR